MTADIGITAADFARAMQKLGIADARPKIAIAVSGGGDSLALALLLQEWMQSKDGELLALTVDHQLRPESKAEAAAVQDLLRARGIAHEILNWRGDKPATQIQQRAREARYGLLLEACRRLGFPLLALAHNLEDQAETFWMRLAHGSGLDGLAGMSAVREAEGIKIIRPVLPFSRAQLRTTCQRFAVNWIEDPSNRNAQYLRVKLRGFEAALAEEGLTPARLAQTAQKLEDARQALQVMTEQALAACLHLHPEGYATLKKNHWEKLPCDIQRRVLAAALMILSPQEYPPGFDALEELRGALRAASFAGKTLSGCEIFSRSGDILLVREAAAVETRRPVLQDFLWDRRFILSDFRAGFQAESPEIGALGEAGLSELRKNKSAAKKMESLPFKVKRVLPALWQGENLLAVPHLSYYSPACPAGLARGRIVFHPLELSA